jgi:hypothetical protein
VGELVDELEATEANGDGEGRVEGGRVARLELLEHRAAVGEQVRRKREAERRH